jgi:hypothetical protein
MLFQCIWLEDFKPQRNSPGDTKACYRAQFALLSLCGILLSYELRGKGEKEHSKNKIERSEQKCEKQTWRNEQAALTKSLMTSIKLVEFTSRSANILLSVYFYALGTRLVIFCCTQCFVVMRDVQHAAMQRVARSLHTHVNGASYFIIVTAIEEVMCI